MSQTAEAFCLVFVVRKRPGLACHAFPGFLPTHAPSRRGRKHAVHLQIGESFVVFGNGWKGVPDGNPSSTTTTTKNSDVVAKSARE